MHEYSVVQALLTQCEEYAKANDATKVDKVVVKIGVMSGIEAHFLEVAFNTFKEGSICDGAALIMNIQPVVIECNECRNITELEKNHYCCPTCESIDINIIEGEDMFLMSLEME